MTIVRARKKQTQRTPKPKKPNVFRAPSPSPTPSPAPSVRNPTKAAKEPVPTTKPAAKGKGLKKHPSLVEAATAAQKKKMALARANLAKGRFPMGPWVHIGNLDPEVTEQELTDHFAEAGEAQSVKIRYSPGRAPQAAGYTYAIIVFKNRLDAGAALALNGSRVMGSDYCMVVEPELHELPEVRSLGTPRKPTKGKRLFPRAVQTASGVTQPTALEKTEVWSARPDVVRSVRRATGKRHFVDEVSFTFTVS
ncbi:hypothetical protein DFH07DRAFT_1063032 [Mycena maculata]|uniref:RRM domain-containing protein n=1 Tax=Mycena maculata TaxID=230809 RepID=A0AAD7IPN8_9AGAR|nr:hypothetical protein DFH07DRAFT_1063032 [Mycena maculata]